MPLSQNAPVPLFFPDGKNEIAPLADEEHVHPVKPSQALPQTAGDLIFAYRHMEQVEYYYAKSRMWVKAFVELVAEGNPPQAEYCVKLSGTNKRILDVGLQNLRQPLVVAEPCEVLSVGDRKWTKGAIADFYEATCDGLKVMGYEVLLDSGKGPKLSSSSYLRRCFPPGSPVLAYHSPARGWVGARVATDQVDHDHPTQSSWSPEEQEMNLIGAAVTGPAHSVLSRASNVSAWSEQEAPKPPPVLGRAATSTDHEPPDEPEQGHEDTPPFIPVPSFLVRFRADHLAQLALSGDDTMVIEASQQLQVPPSKLGS